MVAVHSSLYFWSNLGVSCDNFSWPAANLFSLQSVDFRRQGLSKPSVWPADSFHCLVSSAGQGPVFILILSFAVDFVRVPRVELQHVPPSVCSGPVHCS
jgi:hypothetical protein